MGTNQATVRQAFIDGIVNLRYTAPTDIATELRVAVTKNDSIYVSAILDQIPDVLQHDNGGGRVLWQALENGNELIARKLILAGADLNYRSRNGTSILHHFVRKYERLVALMIERGADITTVDRSGNTILYTAVREGFLSIVETISKLDIKYEDEARILKQGALSSYATRVLPWLIASSDVAQKKVRARISLRIYLDAKKNDKIDLNLIKLMVNLALVPRPMHSDICRLLSVIVQYPEPASVAEIILDYVDQLDDKSEEVAVVLCSASKLPQSLMSLMVIHKGADVNWHTKDQEYPLHYACHSRSLPNIHLLLSLGADLRVTDNRKRTPFSYMATDSFREQHKLVLRHFAILSSKKIDFDANDLAKINRHSRMRTYYEECLNELWNMKRTNIYGDVTFFCFFDKSLEELSSLVQHATFLKTYYLNQVEGSVLFPHYSMHIHHIFKMALERKNMLIARAKAYEEATMNGPPYAPVTRAMLDQTTAFENFERKYYFRLHELVNNATERNYGINLLC